MYIKTVTYTEKTGKKKTLVVSYPIYKGPSDLHYIVSLFINRDGRIPENVVPNSIEIHYA